MKNRIFLTLLAICIGQVIWSQNTNEFEILDSLSQEPLFMATGQLKGTSNGGTTDTRGFMSIQNIATGKHVVIFSLLGYKSKEVTIDFPREGRIRVLLAPASGEEINQIIIEGTRSNKSIDDSPTRVEVLTDEIDEASTMDPSKIAHLITHSTGIQVQQTSATSNTANVRIQGMDGKYTQILKDGFPLYGGFSGSLSIMQIPPLDLRQVEYIKGGASTLYGGGAISGLINLISKDASKKESIIHLNASHIGAFDVNSFFSDRVGKIGYTLLAQRNVHSPFDADKDGFSDMPALTKYNLNPKIFFYLSKKTQLSFGGTFTEESRRGGDMTLLNGSFPNVDHFYREQNNIKRTTSQFKLSHKFNENTALTLRNGLNFFNRNLSVIQTNLDSECIFSGQQISSFSEAAVSFRRNKHSLITGLNLYSDRFDEDEIQSVILRDESRQTLGYFVNYSGDLGEKIALEAGLRTDYVIDGELFVLPRVSALFRWTRELTTRIGGGMGYRNPTIFDQQSELYAYRNVLPIGTFQLKAEESAGGNVDIGYKKSFGEHFFFNFNQMFFITRLNAPLILSPLSDNSEYFAFQNIDGYTQSLGAETFFKFGFYDFVFFAGYTYTDAKNYFNSETQVQTLTPKHSLKGDLLYSLPGKWRIGLDYEYKSSQVLSSGRETPDFWTYGAVVEYTRNQYTLFGNIENYTNIRQTKYESLVSQPYQTPQFTEVWAPLDGIVVNVGVKIRID
jgi:iron complex outermembrane receptor protein